MKKTMGHILKSNDVILEGQLRLDTVCAEPSPPGKKTAALEPAACIVENHPEFAVIELTCSCGGKMYLRCEYEGAEASAETSAPDQPPNQTK